uniref:hypothetical protein n=1 Tax=Candidatus Electronema sp. TaxID=2698783 RepID=UPI004057795F
MTNEDILGWLDFLRGQLLRREQRGNHFGFCTIEQMRFTRKNMPLIKKMTKAQIFSPYFNLFQRSVRAVPAADSAGQADRQRISCGQIDVFFLRVLPCLIPIPASQALCAGAAVFFAKSPFF